LGVAEKVRPQQQHACDSHDNSGSDTVFDPT
jgi:hypothetical protein